MRDELTNLQIRKEFFSTLNQRLNSDSSIVTNSALLTIKVHHLKAINTNYGYDVGDQLLIKIVQRISDVCRESDVIARTGHNCFAILLGTIMNKGHASLAMHKLLDVLHELFRIDEHEINIKVSIGASLFPDDAQDSETLFRNAEIALGQAKLTNVKSSFYIEHAPSASTDYLTLECELQKAIKAGDLDLHYQPQIDLASGNVCGAEALMRWNHPSLGHISPSIFIPIAERSGLIDSLTTWALNTSLRYCARCQEQYGNFTIAVNLSVKLLHDRDIVEIIENALLMWGVAPGNLLLEVTETAMMEHPLQSLEVLTRLSAAGIQLSIDDFGTGYSSLSYLKQLPVNELKVDKSFVLSMTKDASNQKIVRSIIDLAHTFDLKVVAEGIENEEVYNILKQMGCDIGQGYLFGKAMSNDDFCLWMNSTAWRQTG